jgi:hypothetical protein
MNTDINIADFVVHLHPDSSCDDCEKIERDLRNREGVVQCTSPRRNIPMPW